MVLSCNSAFACTCVQVSHRDEFLEASAVFAGKVIEVREDTSYLPSKLNVSSAIQKIVDSTKRYLVTLRIEQNFKGAAGKEVVLYAFQSDSSCMGLMFMQSEKYLIYAVRNQGRLSDGGLCSRTSKLDKTSKEYRELVRSFRTWSKQSRSQNK